MGSFGGLEIAIIVLVVLLLFGAKKIPELARGMGQGINEFRKASNEIKSEIEHGQRETDFNNRNSGNQQNQQSGQQNSEKTKANTGNA
jgi:sec-independent protein translocase protein TatA